MSEIALLGLIAGLHLVALGGGAVLVIALARAGGDGPGGASPDGPQDRGDGGPSPRPVGPPLPDASQARVRLREPGRIADALRHRHPTPVPAQPARQGGRDTSRHGSRRE